MCVKGIQRLRHSFYRQDAGVQKGKATTRQGNSHSAELCANVNTQEEPIGGHAKTNSDKAGGVG